MASETNIRRQPVLLIQVSSPWAAIVQLTKYTSSIPSTMDSWLNETRRPRIWLGAISAMYSGESIEAMPTPTPHRMR